MSIYNYFFIMYYRLICYSHITKVLNINLKYNLELIQDQRQKK